MTILDRPRMKESSRINRSGRTGRPRKEFDPVAAGPFGTFVWNAITSYESETGRDVSLEDIALQSGLDYSHLHRLIRGNRGMPLRPEIATVRRILDALGEHGIAIDIEEAYRMSSMLPEGFRIVQDDADIVAVSDKTREIAARIKDRREYLRRNGRPELTQQYIAEKLGMHQSNYNKVEAGNVPLNASSLGIVAELLDVPAGFFHGDMLPEEVDRHEIVQFYDGLPPKGKELARKQMEQLKDLFAQWDEEDNEGTIGKKS